MASIVKLGTLSRKRTNEVRDMRTITIDDHQRIVIALKARDAKAARLAMKEHLDHVEQYLREVIEGKPG
jgi:DNA-binding GntR family transcriptional regulator